MSASHSFKEHRLFYLETFTQNILYSPFISSSLKRETFTFKQRKILKLSQVEKSDALIVYLHGGAYVFNISQLHYLLISDIVKKTGISAYVLDYPLASDHTGHSAYEYVLAFLKTISDKKILLIGDSAGAGLALACAQALKDKIHHLFLLSPMLDASLSDERQIDLEKIDPLLSIVGLKNCARLYAGSLPLNDPIISPIYNTMKDLSPVSVYTSDCDLLMIDSIRLIDQLKENNRSYTFTLEKDLIHDWIIMPFTKEARVSKDQIIQQIKNCLS